MRIALDAMGTDKRPVPDVAGGVQAAREFGDTILLLGDEKRIHAELEKHDTSGLQLEVIHAEDEIKMDDKPSAVMKSRPQSPMHKGMNMVRDGEADAFVTMGNTGAAHAIATLSTLRRIPGVKRPALTALYPVNRKPIIFLDVGANADSKVEWLEQFAVMGSIYAEKVLKRSEPRIATLSNGEEEGKGNELVRETQRRLQQLEGINYVGHIEPKEILQASADVIVMDGFVGNIFIKTFEASVSYFSQVIRQEITASFVSKIGALLSRSAFKQVRQRMDTGEVGGAPLLGVNGVVIIGHGSAEDYAVKNAIRQARQAVAANLIEETRAGLSRLGN